VRAGRLRVPRTARRVPRRIRAAIERGLAVDPDARFAALDALLGELAWPPLRRARWAIGACAALAAAGWLIARSPSDVADERCTGAATEFATAWNPERRSAVETAFAASRAPFAATALPRLTSALDHYAARWTQAHTAACRATRILGAQTEAMLDLRMACLERRRQEVAALVATLAAADANAIARSVSAAAGLTDITACADLAALQQIVAPPTDEATRRKLAALATRLADARARYETGAFAPALERTRQIAAEARGLAYRPFAAEALLQQGLIETSVGDASAAEPTLEAAVWSAEAGRSDEIAARAWVSLVFLVGYRKGEFARGLALAPRATAALARLGGNADIEAGLERALGAIDFAQRKLDDAAAHDEKAVMLAERAFGAKHINVAKALEGLGATVMEQGRIARGISILQQALHLYEDLLGPDHPWVARTLHNLGQAHITARKNAEAEQELRRAAAIREAALGPDAPDLAETLSSLGVTVRRRGDLQEALGLHRRAVALAERAFGPESLVLLALLVELGTDLGILGHHAEADQQLRRAVAIATKVLGPDHIKTAFVVIAHADGLMLQSRWHDAASRYEHAIPILEKAQGTAEDLAGAVSSLGRAYVELHQPRRALAPLERLESKPDEVPPELRPALELTLARALWDSGGDRRRAHELATRARADGKAVEIAQPGEVAQIERWLASHPIR
jgi:tetratricopeptide (TPR) repeat protein